MRSVCTSNPFILLTKVVFFEILSIVIHDGQLLTRLMTGIIRRFLWSSKQYFVRVIAIGGGGRLYTRKSMQNK
jgi:hypothetical protein